MAQTLGGEGFEDLSERDIVETLADQELGEEDLIEMVNHTSKYEDESDADENKPNTFTAKVVRERLEIGRKLGNYFQQNNPNVDRALRFQRKINECLRQYEEVYKDLAKNKSQSLITDFLSTSHQTQTNSNALTIETRTEIILSSDDSTHNITQKSKRRRLLIETDSDSDISFN